MRGNDRGMTIKVQTEHKKVQLAPDNETKELIRRIVQRLAILNWKMSHLILLQCEVSKDEFTCTVHLLKHEQYLQHWTGWFRIYAVDEPAKSVLSSVSIMVKVSWMKVCIFQRVLVLVFSLGFIDGNDSQKYCQSYSNREWFGKNVHLSS